MSNHLLIYRLIYLEYYITLMQDASVARYISNKED